MALKVKKQIYDNVHGYIGLTETELGVVNSPLFQRLRSILQLESTYLVYPGATHTRFEHSLGAMFMIDQFMSYIKKDGELLSENEELVQKMRLAALLHDIGHYPLSHAIEKVVVNALGGKDHVKFGSELIKDFFAGALSSYRPREIIDIMSGTDKAGLSVYISSAFDADKSDYLLRDAYYTGVGYGRVGLQRLIRTASYEKGNIIFGKDEAAVESFLLGRYHMFRSVYHHKTVISFKVMIERIFELLVKEGAIAHPNDVLGSGDEMSIFGYDDHMLFSAMNSYARNGKDGFLKELIGMYLLRKPLCAAYINPVTGEGTDASKANIRIKEMCYNSRKTSEFARASGIERSEWIFPVYLRPLGLVDDDTPVFVRRGSAIGSLANSSALVLHMIGKKKLYDARIYAPAKYKSRISRALA
ncbi:MAG: HD domain-containing protein [Candidatus Micrarchaeota archaeon]|nr:HD domain-containing protein [Candidatus Micrarchaeota archaeon]